MLFELEIAQLHEKVKKLEKTVSIFNEANLLESENNKLIVFYTGLPNSKVLRVLFNFVAEGAPFSSCNTKLSSFEEFMVTLIKLRLNLPMQDLAFRFGVSCSTVQRIFYKWMKILDTQLQPLINWPDREDLRRTMPGCFKVSFGDNVAVIIDCFEIFIERPSSLLARAATCMVFV